MNLSAVYTCYIQNLDPRYTSYKNKTDRLSSTVKNLMQKNVRKCSAVRTSLIREALDPLILSTIDGATAGVKAGGSMSLLV